MNEKTITQELIDLRTRGRILYALFIVTQKCLPQDNTEEVLSATEHLSDSEAEIFARKYEEYMLTQERMRYEVLDYIQKEATHGI